MSNKDYNDDYSSSNGRKHSRNSDNSFEDIYSDYTDAAKKDRKSKDIDSGRDAYENIDTGIDEYDKYRPNVDAYNSFDEYDPYSDDANNYVDRRQPQQAEWQDGNDDYNERSGKRPPTKKKRKKRGCGCFPSIVALLLVFVLLAGAGAYAFAYGVMGTVTFDDAFVDNVHVNKSNLLSKAGVTNILLIGVDRREAEEESRSDTMILFTIDSNNNQLKMTSFLRDIWVEIPGYNDSKLNSANSWGGPQLTVDTIEYNFGIDIDGYVLVDFEMFSHIIDDLGGIDVEVTADEAAFAGSGLPYAPDIDLVKGMNTLTGSEALWYARMRYLDNDFERTNRQRKVLSAMIQKATKAGPVNLVNMAKKVLPNLVTSIPQTKLTNLGMRGAVQLLTYDLVQMHIPVDGSWKSVSSPTYYFSIDFAVNKAALSTFVFEKVEKEVETEKNKKE